MAYVTHHTETILQCAEVEKQGELRITQRHTE